MGAAATKGTKAYHRLPTGELELIETVGDARLLVPFYAVGILAPPEFSEAEWSELQDLLNRPLSPELREGITAAGAVFFDTVAAKPDLPSFRKYRAALGRRLEQVIGCADELFQMCAPRIHAGTESGGKETHVMPVENAVSFYFQQVDDTLLSDLYATLQRLQRAGYSAMREVAPERVPYAEITLSGDSKEPHGGAEGHVQLNVLLTQLMFAARDAGDSLDLMSNEYRSQESDEPETPMFKFIVRILDFMREKAAAAVRSSELVQEDKEAVSDLFEKYLSKSPERYQSQLLEIRTAIEGGRKGKK